MPQATSAATPQPPKATATYSQELDPRPRALPATWQDYLAQMGEDEKQEALEIYAKQARHQLWREHYTWGLRNPQAQAAAPTARDLARQKLAQARLVNPLFMNPAGVPGKMSRQQMKELRRAFWVLCLFFAGDSRFLALNPRYSWSKGIIIQGPLGVGKTTLLELFGINPRRTFTVVESREVNREYKKHGPKTLEPYEKPQGLCLDDLGLEANQVQWMGNYDAPLEELLSTRYSLLKRYPGKGPLTHATTNLPVLRKPEHRHLVELAPDESNSLEMHYGNRVTDRFKEMFNQVTIPPTLPSLR